MLLTVGFSKPKGKFLPVFSWLIRLVEWTKYSHVYVSWETSYGVTVVYEASGTTVKFMNAALHAKQAETIDSFKLEISDQAKYNLIKFCLENVGRPYGAKQIVGIAYVKLARLFRCNVKNPFKDGHYTQVCSELVGYVLRDVLGKDLDLDLEAAGPRDIYEYLNKEYR